MKKHNQSLLFMVLFKSIFPKKKKEKEDIASLDYSMIAAADGKYFCEGHNIGLVFQYNARLWYHVELRVGLLGAWEVRNTACFHCSSWHVHSNRVCYYYFFSLISTSEYVVSDLSHVPSSSSDFRLVWLYRFSRIFNFVHGSVESLLTCISVLIQWCVRVAKLGPNNYMCLEVYQD